MPIRIGMPTKKTIVVPCIVNNWLNVSGAEEVVARVEELPAHQEGLDAADDQEDQAHEDVQDADLLVIDGASPSRGARPSRAGSPALDFSLGDGHSSPLRIGLQRSVMR